jgi:hypothetical protein
MAEVVGAPYNAIPPAMFIGFSGGIQHRGTICGALVAPVALISSVVADKKIRGQMLDELMAWYIHHPFPEYQPHGLNLHKVAVGSTLCHISVSKWIKFGQPAGYSAIEGKEGQVRRCFRRYSEKDLGNIECLGGHRHVRCGSQASFLCGDLHGMS